MDVNDYNMTMTLTMYTVYLGITLDRPTLVTLRYNEHLSETTTIVVEEPEQSLSKIAAQIGCGCQHIPHISPRPGFLILSCRIEGVS